MTSLEARHLLGLRDDDKVYKRGLLAIKKDLEDLNKVWSRSKYDIESTKLQIEAVNVLLKEAI